MNLKGPLEDVFERFFYDKYKLKTTTVVSYGLRPLVRLSDDGPLFSKWSGENKDAVKLKGSDEGLSSYILYCTQELNIFMSATKATIGKRRWDSDPKNAEKVLNTTFVNGIVSCFRRIVIANQMGTFEHYLSKLKGLDRFVFSKYRSSQYNSMGEEIYNTIYCKMK